MPPNVACSASSRRNHRGAASSRHTSKWQPAFGLTAMAAEAPERRPCLPFGRFPERARLALPDGRFSATVAATLGWVRAASTRLVSPASARVAARCLEGLPSSLRSTRVEKFQLDCGRFRHKLERTFAESGPDMTTGQARPTSLDLDRVGTISTFRSPHRFQGPTVVAERCSLSPSRLAEKPNSQRA